MLASAVVFWAGSALATPSELESCRRLLAAAPQAEAGARCFYGLASGPSASSSAATTLAELESAEPGSPWISLYLARLRWLANSPEVETLYRRAISRAVAGAEVSAEVQARCGLSRLLSEVSQLPAAEREAQRALAVARSSQNAELVARASVAGAQVAVELGEDLERSYSSLLELETAAASEPTLWRAYQLVLAELAQRTGRFAAARQAHARLAEAAAKSGQLAWVATARYSEARVVFDELSELPSETGRAELLALANSAVAAARAAARPDIEAAPLWMLGSLLPPEPARSSLESCFAQAQEDRLKSYCRSALARVLTASEPDAARAAMEEAHTWAERSGDAFAKTAAWQERLRLAWNLEPPQRARAQSWAALDAIETLRDRQAGSESQPGLFSTWAEAYYNFSGRLLAEGSAADLAEGFRVIERLRARTLIDALRLGAAPNQEAPTLELAALQAGLGADQALLSFQVAPWQDFRADWGGGAWLLAATRDQARTYRLPGRGETRLAQHMLAGLVPGRNGSELPAVAHLHERWLKPALSELPPSVHKLVIVPDDALHYLPFAALRSAADQPPLAARFELTFAPSASVWAQLRQPRSLAAQIPALVFVDPVASGSAPLPFARREAATIRRLLGPAVQRLSGAEATEEALVSARLDHVRVLHLAVHATVDALEPKRSFVTLAAGGGRDGRLEASEIAGLRLPAQLVVLSSCNSAGGAVLRGEGVMSLARAFFLAGAKTVVATLWPLRDDDGAALFERFYAHLGRGASVAAALSLAQRERLAAGAPSEAWAGVVVLGNGESVPFPGGVELAENNSPWLAIFLVLLALAVLGAFGRHRAHGA